MTMKPTRIGLLIACSLALGACSSVEDQARDEFVDGCTSQGAPEEACECVYGKLEGRYGAQHMSTMKEIGPPPDFVEAVVLAGQQCRDGNTSTTLHLPSDNVAPDQIVEEPDPEPEFEAHVPSDDEVEQLIQRYESMHQGEENPDVRQVRKGDVSGGGVDEAVVLFTVESVASNTYQQFLAVITGAFETTSFAGDVVVVGGSSEQVHDLGIEDGAIELHVLTLGPNDPDCCPSVRSRVEYLWHNGKLKRVT